VVSGVEGFNPEDGGHVGLKKKGPDYIICGSYHPFSATVLGRCIGARQAQGNAVCGEKRAKLGGEKFATVVTL
jgi:hypothetical protein